MTDSLDSYLPNRRYFRPDEVARLYGVSTSTIRAWVREGKIDAVRLAGVRLLRIPRGELQKIEKDVAE